MFNCWSLVCLDRDFHRLHYAPHTTQCRHFDTLRVKSIILTDAKLGFITCLWKRINIAHRRQHIWLHDQGNTQSKVHRVNMTQRQTHPCVCDTEGDTKAKTDFIKYMSEQFLLELQLYGFWGSNFRRSICSSGFLYQRADYVPYRWKINIPVCKLAGHLLFIWSTIKYILKAKIIQRGSYENMIPHPHIGTLLSTREISLRTN